MFVIGVTGPTGAGKSDICRELSASLRAKWIDSDVIARKVVEKGEMCLCELCKTFGNDILLEDGSLDRKKLGSIAFSDKEKLLCLNRITHKYIAQRIRVLLAEYSENEDYCLLDAPLLFESGLDSECDINLCVLADKDVRQKRIEKRDKIDSNSAQIRIKAQKKDSFYINRCDFVLFNNSEIDISELVQRIRIEAMKR